MLNKYGHVVMMLITLIIFGLSYYFDAPGLLMVVLIGIPALMTGYLYAKRDAHMAVEQLRLQSRRQ